MKKILQLIVAAILLIMATSVLHLSAHAAMAQQANNNVGINFVTTWVYESSEDNFINGQVTGYKWWATGLRNNEDDTKAPVKQLSLQLDSNLNFDNFNSEGLVSSGPPVYEWNYGDIPERASTNTFIDSSTESIPITFTPGFDASRSVDKVEFQKEGIQIVTIKLTPRETIEGFSILIQAEENNMVNPVITSPTGGEGINLSPDGHSLNVDKLVGLELDKEWTMTVTIKVSPKVLSLQYTPYVMIGSQKTVASGTTNGSTISKLMGDPEDEAGTWTWRADGDYEWYWEQGLTKRVAWPHDTSKEGPVKEEPDISEGNRVKVDFTSEYTLEVDGDTFTNDEVNGQVNWRIPNIVNTTDETGEPVRGLRVTLDSDLAFERIMSGGDLTRRGPPTYEWVFGDLVEEHLHTGWATDVIVGFAHQSPIKFTPGFDVSRSFDKTVFTAPDTQTVTVTVTPRDERIAGFLICVHASTQSDLVDATIISHSGYGDIPAHVTPDGQYSGIGEYWPGIPVEHNTPITITVTFQVTPKVPIVEYKPAVGVNPQWFSEHDSFPNSGIDYGDSFSYTNEAGTWTVSAEGDYVWEWAGSISSGYGVGLLPRTNSPPTLTSGTVSPTSGSTVTPFTFEATYKDTENAPSYVRVYIDGSATDMKYIRGAEQGYAGSAAVFQHKANLNAGLHNYYFETSDGSLTTRFPEDGTLSIQVTAFPVWIIVAIVAGAVIIGLIIYLLIRKRRGRAS